MPIDKISICHLRVELKRLEQAMIRYEVAIDAQLAGEPDVAYRRQVKERDVSFYAVGEPGEGDAHRVDGSRRRLREERLGFPPGAEPAGAVAALLPPVHTPRFPGPARFMNQARHGASVPSRTPVRRHFGGTSTIKGWV